MKKLFIFLSIIFLSQACEDPIDVTLDDAEAQWVIDAWLDNTNSIQTIRVTKSLPYFESQFTPGVTGASVTVLNSNGNSFSFEDQGNGDYTYDPGNSTIGEIGDNFELSVELDGVQLSSSTTLNRVPPIDSLVQEFRDDEVFLDDGIYCQVFARDFDGLGDTYWIKSYKNDTFLNRASEINIAFDAGFDSGGEVDGFVFIFPIRDLVNATDNDNIPTPWFPGDDLKVEIHSISNDAFAFLEIMRDQLLNSQNGIFAEPLANTKGNVSANDGSIVLGVFNVAAISADQLTIEE